jgi:radical SAM superfamily enzyme with C-terminal helix-hairpin-helix motif
LTIRKIQIFPKKKFLERKKEKKRKKRKKEEEEKQFKEKEKKKEIRMLIFSTFQPFQKH